MSDVSSQKSVGDDSNQLFTSSEANDEKKGEDSWTDVSLNDDSDTTTKAAKETEKGPFCFPVVSYSCFQSQISDMLSLFG